MTGMLPLQPLARLDRMIVEVETSLAPLQASIDLNAQAGQDVALWRAILVRQERHLALLHRNREQLLL
jgi:hypothetical protein